MGFKITGTAPSVQEVIDLAKAGDERAIIALRASAILLRRAITRSWIVED